MGKILEFLASNIGKAVLVPVLVDVSQVLMIVAHSLGDGVITHEELLNIIKAGNGLNTVILLLVIAYLKFKGKE